MSRMLVAALLSLTTTSCFLYPGEGECDPETFVAQCRGREALNCTDVTPVGYGSGVINRYAAMPEPCGAKNVCILTEWNDAACVAPSRARCEDEDLIRCVDGFKETCRLREALRRHDQPSGMYWVATRETCTGDESPRKVQRTYPGPPLPDPVEGDLERDGIPDRIEAKDGPSTTGDYRWSVVWRHGYASERELPVRADLWAREVSIAEGDVEGISDIIAIASEPLTEHFSESHTRYRFTGREFEPISVRRLLEFDGDGPRSEWFEWKVKCEPGACKELCAEHEFQCLAGRACVDGACDGLGF